MSSFGKVDLRGPGALPLVQRLADNNLDVAVGKVVYTQFLNTRGGVVADVTITRLESDAFRMVTGSAFIGHDLGWVQMHLDPADGAVDVREVTEDLACLGLWGPQARLVLSSISDSDLSNDANPYMTARPIHLAGFDVLAQRVTYVGELGWELYVPRERALAGVGRAGRRRGWPRAGSRGLQGARLPAPGKGIPLPWDGRDGAREPL